MFAALAGGCKTVRGKNRHRSANIWHKCLAFLGPMPGNKGKIRAADTRRAGFPPA